MASIQEKLHDLVPALREEILDWAREKSASARIPLLIYLIYAGLRHLADPMYRSWFAGLTLVLHEMGHLMFSSFGRTMMFLGGSIVQIAAPLGAAVYLLLRQRDWFGLIVGGSWLAFSEWEMATYMADANKEQLALVGFSGRPEHDWSTLFTQWHVLNACETIASAVRGLALVTWLASVALGAWICWLILRDGTRRGTAL